VSVGAGLSFWLLTALTQATAWPGGPSLWMTWAGLVGLATMGTLIPLAAVFGSMKRLGPTRTALLSLSEPVFATLLGVIVLGEDMTILRAVGALLVVAAGVLAVR
jgi:drug/metabolite transporter (DMT)-like permease